MLRTVFIPYHTDYVITLPQNYLNRSIEIIVFPVDSSCDDQDSLQPLQLTVLEPDRLQRERHDELVETFTNRP